MRAKAPELKADLMYMEVVKIYPEHLTALSAAVWGMTGFAIGGFFILLSAMGLLYGGQIPGTNIIFPASQSWYLLGISVVITLVLSIFYAMIGGLLGTVIADVYDMLVEKLGGIQMQVITVK